MSGPFTVAIDGPAASGKGTISHRVADEFGFAHLDTGLLYRAVAQKVLDGANAVDAARHLTAEDLSNEEILRTADVAQEASRVAAIPEVRSALVDFQVAFARRSGGAVLDGRDIGTVICPQAEAKLFVTASDEVRAGRRYLELKKRGADVTLDGVLADLRARDTRDSARTLAPLKPAGDAVVLDTTTMFVDEAVAAAIEIVRERRGD